MNRIAGMLLSLMVVMVMSGCSRIRTLQRELPVVDAMTMGDDAEGYLEALRGDGVIVVFSTGDSLPLKAIAELPFASLESGDNLMVFTRPVWVLLSRGGAWISPDGKRYAPVYDVKGIKKLFGARHGSLTIGFAISREEGTQLQAGVSLH